VPGWFTHAFANPCCILVTTVPPSAIIVALPADALTIAVAPIFVVVGIVTEVAVVFPVTVSTKIVLILFLQYYFYLVRFSSKLFPLI
jgi:hypothetical protein